MPDVQVPPNCQPDVVAAFDVDGTLVRGESLLRFLVGAVGIRALIWGAARGVTRLGVGPGSIDRSRVKSALLDAVLCGRPKATLDRHGERFARHLVDRRMLPDATNALRAHQHAGHLTVLISASPDFYIAPLGHLLNVDAVLCTAMEVDPEQILTGRLAGPNVRGQHKVQALHAWMRSVGIDPALNTLHAYGNGPGDDQLLALSGLNAHDRRIHREFAPEHFPEPTGNEHSRRGPAVTRLQLPFRTNTSS